MAPLLNGPFFRFYDWIWSVALPLLRSNQRLREGYRQRILEARPQAAADLWIQAASVGEALLAWELLKRCDWDRPLNGWVTTNTAQGLQILERAITEIEALQRNLQLGTGYFPFDKPELMRAAVRTVRPKVMVLLETELWPAHLAALKETETPVLLLNGRITAQSLKRYRIWPSLWRRLRPDRILAVSDADAHRFGQLFGEVGIGVMPNIKFDRLGDPHPESRPNPLAALLPADAPVLVLGSVREQEEGAVQKIVTRILERRPDTVVALFPRHLHRLDAWKVFFKARRLPWHLRSRIERPITPGSVVLWDTFGELSHAYRLATAAFVGGSLAPLGGQNFLEPLISGIKPVIGPHWETFQWVGQEILDLGLVRVVEDWKGAADALTNDIARPAPTEEVRRQARRYISARQGGTAKACAVIREYL